MTRHRIKSTLRRVYWLLGAVLFLSLAAKLASHVPGLAGTPAGAVAAGIYDYIKDMAPVFIAFAAAYLANVFQKRSKFVESLEEEWRNIVRTKSVLYSYFEKPYPSSDDYIATFARLSETIDTMRIVYRNAGETATLVGLYPYAPLHDMRRILEDMDPRLRTNLTPEKRKLAQECVKQVFNALRENFLEELDLEEPRHPLLIWGGHRLKVDGHSNTAARALARQREVQSKHAAPSAQVHAELFRLFEAEERRRTGFDGAAVVSNGKSLEDHARGRDV